jgi:hypothetical protein
MTRDPGRHWGAWSEILFSHTCTELVTAEVGMVGGPSLPRVQRVKCRVRRAKGRVRWVKGRVW